MEWRVFSERLKELRKESKLTAMQLGRAIGVSDAAVIRWEQGLRIPGIDSLYKIAKYFNVSPAYLIGFED